MKALIIGAPGVGKTTVLKRAMDNLPRYEVVNLGTKMLEIGRKQNLVENRDEIRKLPPKKIKELQRKTAKELSEKENIIIDTHFAVETPKGILPGVPKWSLNQLNIDRILLIEADSEEIKNRRSKDQSRKRNDFKLDPGTLQEINRNYAATASTLTGALIKIIKNEKGKINKAAEKIVKTMEED